MGGRFGLGSRRTNVEDECRGRVGRTETVYEEEEKGKQCMSKSRKSGQS